LWLFLVREERGFVSFNKVVVAENVATANTTIELLDIITLLIHECTHLALRIAQSNMNYHSPLKLKKEFNWEPVYGKANEPDVLEAGCVVERLLFGFRPNWASVRKYEKQKMLPSQFFNYSEAIFKALISGSDISAIQQPSGFPERPDHVTGLDSLDLQYE